jgi:hypothetical protein
MGEGVPLSYALLPLPPVAKVVGKHLGMSGCSHPAGVTLINFFSLFVLLCLFAL